MPTPPPRRPKHRVLLDEMMESLSDERPCGNLTVPLKSVTRDEAIALTECIAEIRGRLDYLTRVVRCLCERATTGDKDG